MLEKQWRGRVLVTGASGVIGGAIARSLCDGGWQVIAQYCTNSVAAEALASQTNCEIRRAGVSCERDVSELFRGVAPLHAVVHAAGLTRDELLFRQNEQDWKSTLRVNATGSFLIAKAALEKLQDGGGLLMIGSRVALRGRRGQTAYAASKGAMVGLMQTAATEGVARNLRVNMIMPGIIDSPMSISHKETGERASLQTTSGSVTAVTGAVRWLLSDDSAGISGQIFHCDDRLN